MANEKRIYMEKNVCAVGCEGGLLDETLKKLNTEGWTIRQVYQESPSYYRQPQELPAPAYYRVFAHREETTPPKVTSNVDGREAEALKVIRDNPALSQKRIVDKLRAMGIQRSMSWVGNKRFAMFNATTTP